jgi:hypothetical protein
MSRRDWTLWQAIDRGMRAGATYTDLVQLTGRSKGTVGSVMRALRAEDPTLPIARATPRRKPALSSAPPSAPIIAYSIKMAAKEIGISEDDLRDMISRRDIPVARVLVSGHSTIVVPLAVVTAWKKRMEGSKKGESSSSG